MAIFAPPNSSLQSVSTTSNFNTSSSTAVQVTSLTKTITVPEGSRGIWIVATLPNITIDTALTTPTMSVWDGTVGSGTQVGQARGSTQGTATYLTSATVSVALTPAAGSKTYNVGLLSTAGNSITAAAASTAPNTLVIWIA